MGKDPAQGIAGGRPPGHYCNKANGVRQRRRVGSIADNCPSDLPPALPRALVGPSATPTPGVPSPGAGVHDADRPAVASSREPERGMAGRGLRGIMAA
jgi:hypothetical protein